MEKDDNKDVEGGGLGEGRRLRITKGTMIARRRMRTSDEKDPVDSSEKFNQLSSIVTIFTVEYVVKYIRN